MTARAYLILVLFLIWSAFSWWWYTCKINGLCISGSYQTANISGNQDQENDVQSRILSSDIAKSKDDKVSDEDQTIQGLDEGVFGENGMDKSEEVLGSDESDSETASENLNVTDENQIADNATGNSQEAEDMGSGTDELSEITEENRGSTSSESESIVRLEDKTLIYFNYLSDNPELNSEAQNYLNQIANDLSSDRYKSIRVTGYTDNIGNTKNNYYKGLDRARAIRDYLKQNGARENQIELKSYGEYRPVADNSTEEGRAKNRRVEIKLNY